MRFIITLREDIFSKKNLILISVFVCVGYYAYLVFYTKSLFNQYDAYYYASIADSHADSGRWENLTTVPNSELLTPQTGIIFIHALLHKLNISDIHSRLLIISAFNALLIVIATYYCFLILQQLGVPVKDSWILSASLPVTLWYQSILLQPTNDAVFFTLSLIAIWLILKHEHDKKKMLVILSFSTIISLFRLTGCLIFAAAIFMQLKEKHYRSALLYFAALNFSLVSPLVVNEIAGFDFSDINNYSSTVVSLYNVEYFYEHAIRTAILNIPESFLRMTYFTNGFTLPNEIFGIIIFFIFVFVFILSIKRVLKENKNEFIFIYAYIILNIAFFQFFTAQPSRYLLFISPLLILPFISYQKELSTKISVGLFAAFLTISIIGIFANDKKIVAEYKQQYSNDIAMHIHQQSFQLLSQFPRVTYFLIHKSAAKTVDYAVKEEPDAILIVGTKEYIVWVFGEIIKINPNYKLNKLEYYFIEYSISDNKIYGVDYEPQIYQSAWVTRD